MRERYAARLVEDGVIAAGDEAAMVATPSRRRLRDAHERLRAAIEQARPPPPLATEPATPQATGDAVWTAVEADRLGTLNEELLRVPDGFT